MTVADLSVKFKSKIELYNVLVREGNIYLPQKQDATQKFLREIMMRKKLYVEWSNVKVIKAQQYKGLHVKDLLRYASTKVNIEKYLPDYEYAKDPNREWLCNIINTLMREEFHKFIQEKINKRKQELIKSQNLGVKAIPEFVNIFRRFQAVSTMKGKSHFIVRIPKENKDKNIVKKFEEKEEKSQNESKIKSLNKEIDNLKFKLQELEDFQRDNDDNMENYQTFINLESSRKMDYLSTIEWNKNNIISSYNLKHNLYIHYVLPFSV